MTDTFELPGPAGLASVPLDDGGRTLEVDFADPDLVCGSDIDVEKVRGQMSMLGRLAILLAEHDTGRRAPVVRAAAALEAANLVVQLQPHVRVAVHPEPLWRDAADALAPTQSVDERCAPHLRLAVEYTHHRDDDLRRTFERLLRDTEPFARVPNLARAVEVAAPMPAAPAMARRAARWMSAPPGPKVTVDVDPTIDVTPIDSSLVDGVLQVAIRPVRAPDHLFLRAFAASDILPLAIVPFEQSPFGSASATALVPCDTAHAQLRVDVTPAAAAPVLSDALRTATLASRIGQDACRSERRGDSDAARLGWRRCADAWRAVGDDRRATLAEARPPAVARDALLCDLID